MVELNIEQDRYPINLNFIHTVFFSYLNENKPACKTLEASQPIKFMIELVFSSEENIKCFRLSSCRFRVSKLVLSISCDFVHEKRTF